MRDLTGSLAGLLALMRATGVTELELAEGDTALRLSLPSRPLAGAVPEATPRAAPAVETVHAVAFGILLLRHPAETRDPPAAGDTVARGDILAYLAVGPLLQPVVAPCDGAIEAVRGRDGEIAGFGAPLFDILPLAADTKE
ncbi:hypothetical protein [Pseudoroseomonas sp. WGS1072]|uniref:hypothetical protein n=1 Tax=Roseomonas sp. WGS1072 TaxID=3366816 RepID=UPI003BF1CC02